MDSIDEILNPTDSTEANDSVGTEPEETETDVEATGETTQVAAGKADTDVSSAQIKAELSALAQERARIRQKEAALDEERARLANSAPVEAATHTETASDPRAELKSLRKQHRDALLEGVGEEEVEEMEERMEELRLSIYNQANQTASAQEKVNSEFNTVYAAVHDEFPFLRVGHPDVNQELNEDINVYYWGRIQKGDSQAVALRKAVDKFAPAYAQRHTDNSENDSTADKLAAAKERKAAADNIVKEKLGKSGFSEVRSVSRSQATKSFNGPTPMEDILRKVA